MKTVFRKYKNNFQNTHRALSSLILAKSNSHATPELCDPTSKSTSSDTDLHVPRSTVIRGDLSHPGTVVIAGTVLGNVSCRHLTINEKARIRGDVTAQELIIDGALTGTVSAPRIMFRPTSRVEGPVYCNWFKLEQGAYFEGRMRRMAPSKPLDPSSVDIQRTSDEASSPPAQDFASAPLALAV